MNQGDQYILPITVTLGSVPVTDQNVQGVKIALGGTVKEWPGDMDYADGAFQYPLTQAQTIAFGQAAPLQAQVNTDGSTILTSPVQMLEVEPSIILEVWE